jgi:hypothetical protein
MIGLRRIKSIMPDVLEDITVVSVIGSLVGRAATALLVVPGDVCQLENLDSIINRL